MKLKKLFASLLIMSMAVTSVTSCDLLEDEDDDGSVTQAVTEESQEGGTRSAPATPLQLTVDKNTGNMEITRPVSQETPMADDGSWTIFVYICGADLESGDGAATGDIEEMCAASASDDVRFVVQTGGASDWQNDYANNGNIGRFIIQDNQVQELDQLDDADMGDTATLTDFIKWGVAEYPGERMGLIFWNHGGGSITGVCFDENHEGNSLSLREIDSALYSAFPDMTDRFEFIGFDACLMGTVETANILASYARYMVGSQETEPGNGWDYTSIGNFLADNPECSGAELGEAIADGFYDSCAAISQEDDCTLSVIDLDKMDDLVKAFNDFAKNMYEASETTSVQAAMIRGIEEADNFGGNNRSEGYTNMVDMAGIINACSDYADGSAALSAINEAVVYNKTGPRHSGCSGLSMYYPLSVEGSTELSVFESVTISPFFASFVDRQDFSSAINYDPDQQGQSQGGEGSAEGAYYDSENGCYYYEQDGVQYCYVESEQAYYFYDNEAGDWAQIQDDNQTDYSSQEYSSNDDYGYSDEYFYDDNGQWESTCEYDYDDNSGCYRSRSANTDHWTYADGFEATGESSHITFLQDPNLNGEGVYNFTLTRKAVDRSAYVCAYVYQILEGDEEAILIGETIDIEADWDKGYFEDGFDGYWLSLPDGQNLSTSIVDYSDDYVVYTSPILLNGNETYLRMKLMLESGELIVEGTWDGIDANGAAARNIRPLVKGDKIVPLYDSLTIESGEEGQYEGAEFKVKDDFEIVYSLLDEADFLYAFIIEDIYNDYYMTDFMEFNVDAAGNVSYYEYE